jgi:DNA-binding CsgD family transcriptional regulator
VRLAVRVQHKGLTPREREVALLVERKLSNDEIARTLGIKPGTVKIHVHNIFIKLEARDSELGPGPRRWSRAPATAAGRKRISEAQRRRW